MGRGCSVGSLNYPDEKGPFLDENWLQEAVFPLVFLASFWVAFPFTVFLIYYLNFLSKLMVAILISVTLQKETDFIFRMDIRSLA